MKKLLALAIALAVSSVFAEETSNLLTNNWSGAVSYTGTGAGYSGGSTPGYNASNNTIYFGYTQAAVAQTIAVNNALQGSGVQVGGVSYGFSYLNQGTSAGTLSSVVNVTSNTGATLHSWATSHGTTTDWTQFSQSQTFTNPYDVANLGNVSMSITGRDNRFWAGYYGPQVKDPYLKLTYTAATITNPTFGDDTYVSVPLQFGFPFYGKTFTNSWMHSNGVVSFLDPAVPIAAAGYNPGAWAYCCGDQPTVTKPEFSYMIAPLWTDLYPQPSSTFRTEGTRTYQKYTWNNIGEISNGNNLNSFTLEIRPTGFIGVNYDKINIQNQQTWVGTTGDTTLNQINQKFYGIPGLNAHLSSIPNWSMDNTPADQCVSNPLSSPTCAGYTDAMCVTNPLYSTACSGYQQAYLTQQCSANPLYSIECAGYAAAYLTQQCSINPLYSTTCDGYEQAYFTKQCSDNPLYNSRCAGYAEAYLTQQCTANQLYSTACSGYASAYFDQQCKLNSLYDQKCTGYADAYFSQQCTLNGLYDQKCPNYATAYATKILLEQQGTASIVATAGTVAAMAPAPTTTVSNDGTVSTAPSTTGSTVVDKALPPPATSANSAAMPAAPVQLAPPPPPQGNQPPREERRDERKPEGGPQGGQPPQGGPREGGDKPQPTARQQLAERRAEAAKKEAVEKGKNLANEMGKAADMEQQKQVQNVVIQAMGFTPGFDSYGKTIIPDVVGYRPFTVYNNQVNVDNKRLGWGLYGPSDRLHNDLVDSQFKER